MARVNGLLRRAPWARGQAGSPEWSGSLEWAGGKIDLENLTLEREGVSIALTVMEANLLKYLLEREGRTVSRKELLESVWGVREDTDTRAVDNFIVRLRKYLEEEPARPRHLLTVRGVGYKFVARP
jgi:DNA-binding response OmpR family regulator